MNATSNQTLAFDPKRPIDLICMGRVAVDLYAEQIGGPLKDVQSFRKYLGGCAGNIAVGTARLGLQPAMLSRVGNDEMGRFVRQTLHREGVDTSLLKNDEDHLTALVLLGVSPPDHFPLIFYRNDCADNQISESDLNFAFFKQAKALLVTGTCLAQPKLREVTHKAIKMAKEAGCKVILDIDYRPVLWGLNAPGDGESRYEKSEAVTAALTDILPDMDLIVGTEEEFQIAGGSEECTLAIGEIRKSCAAPLLLKKGALGCEVHLAGKKAAQKFQSFRVEVLNVLGAGDAFLSGFLRGLLRGEAWSICAQYANANGALVVSRHGCAPAMASFDELTYFIKNFGSEKNLLQSKKLALLHRKVEAGNPAKTSMLILAFDHRTQFEETCRREGISFENIGRFKELVVEGFKKSRNRLNGDGAILVDPIYGDRFLRQSSHDDFDIGVPIERAGDHPVKWLDDSPLYQQLLQRPSKWFVKVLIKFHVAMDPDIIRVQTARLQELSKVCDALGRRLMLELLMPEPFKLNGYSLAGAMDWMYSHDIFPFWWKIPPVANKSEWLRVTDVIDRHDPSARIVLLGQNASMQQFENWFSIVKSTHHCQGFAIGRTVFWEAWQQFAAGRLSEEQVPQIISERYLALVGLWRQTSLVKESGKAKSHQETPASDLHLQL